MHRLQTCTVQVLLRGLSGSAQASAAIPNRSLHASPTCTATPACHSRCYGGVTRAHLPQGAGTGGAEHRALLLQQELVW